MGSTRFPGKVMMEIAGKPMLHHLLDRLEKCRNLDEIVVATSVKVQDDVICRFCATRNVPCFRGSEEDVLGRMLGSFQDRKADWGVIVYGDNPLIDPEVVNLAIEEYHVAKCDYLTNSVNRTFPYGTEVEVFSFNSLENAWRNAMKKSEREHVTPYFYSNPNKFNIKHLTQSVDYSIVVANSDVVNKDSLVYVINAIPDKYPAIIIDEHRDTINLKQIFFTGVVKDDYGISRLTFNIRHDSPSSQLDRGLETIELS